MWATVWVYGAAAAAACVALWKSRIPARWRRAALAFMWGCPVSVDTWKLGRNGLKPSLIQFPLELRR